MDFIPRSGDKHEFPDGKTTRMLTRGSIVIQVLTDYTFDKLKTRPQKTRLRQAQPAQLLPSLPHFKAVEGPLPKHAAIEGNRILLTAGIPID